MVDRQLFKLRMVEGSRVGLRDIIDSGVGRGPVGHVEA